VTTVSPKVLVKLISEKVEVVKEAMAFKVEAVSQPPLSSSSVAFTVEDKQNILNQILEAQASVQAKDRAEVLSEALGATEAAVTIPLDADPVVLETHEVDYFNSSSIAEAIDGLMPGRNHTVPEDNGGRPEVTLWSLFNSLEGLLLLIICVIAG